MLQLIGWSAGVGASFVSVRGIRVLIVEFEFNPVWEQ
jgi:hypothetical protein